MLTNGEWMLVLLGNTAFIIGALYLRQELRRAHRPLFYDPRWRIRK